MNLRSRRRWGGQDMRRNEREERLDTRIGGGFWGAKDQRLLPTRAEVRKKLIP